MISIDEAFRLIDECICPLEPEPIAVCDALGAVAAAGVVAGVDLPPFAQSAMDGWALRASDTQRAVEGAPVALRRVGEVRAGAAGALPEVGEGEVARIFTGGQIPPGADAVVRQERARCDGKRVYLSAPVARGRDLRPVGEELSADAQLIEPGERLDEGHLAALSMTGHAELLARRCPRVTLLVSGDEVVDAGRPLKPGEIYDANTPLLKGLLGRVVGAEITVVPVPDVRSEVVEALGEALERDDLVVSTGGVSVGEYDFLTGASEELGVEEVFWKVRQKPGRPVFFGMRGDTPFLGLPGNPGAVFVGAYTYLLRVIDRLQAAEVVRPRGRVGRLAGRLVQSPRAERWAGCRVRAGERGEPILAPIEQGKAHRLSQLYRADGLIKVPAGSGEVAAGEIVTWFALGR